jgi:hypothetical protein
VTYEELVELALVLGLWLESVLTPAQQCVRKEDSTP